MSYTGEGLEYGANANGDRCDLQYVVESGLLSPDSSMPSPEAVRALITTYVAKILSDCAIDHIALADAGQWGSGTLDPE